MRRMRITSTLLVGLAFIVSCNKKDDSSPTQQKLVAGKWQILASVATLNYKGNDTTIDSYSGWRACEQDDLMMFKNNGKGNTDENTNKCDEDDQTEDFTWMLQNNDTRLNITVNGNKVFASNGKRIHSAEIVELTDTELKLKSIENDSTMGEVTWLETYKNVK